MNEIAIKDRADLKDYDIENLIGSFLKNQDVKETTKENYRKCLRQFFLWIRENDISNATREDIIAYKESMRERLSPYSLSLYMVAVRKFFEWIEGMKIYPNVARGIKGAKGSKQHSREPLTPEQARELMKTIKIDTTLNGLRDFAIVNLMIRTGLRDIEVKRANIEDISQKGAEAILWIQGKGRDNKDQFVILTERTHKPIREYLKAREYESRNEPLFCSHSNHNYKKRLTTHSISRLVKKRLREIGLDSRKITAHSLRHTAITFSLLGGATIQEAQALGRHANINTTLIYAHNIDRIKQAPERKIDAFLDNEEEIDDIEG